MIKKNCILDPNRPSTKYTVEELDALARTCGVDLKYPDGKYKKKLELFNEIKAKAEGIMPPKAQAIKVRPAKAIKEVLPPPKVPEVPPVARPVPVKLPGCKVKKACPKGYKRKELTKIAKNCGVELKRAGPKRSLKNMKELCNEIMEVMRQNQIDFEDDVLVFPPPRRALVPVEAPDPVPRPVKVPVEAPDPVPRPVKVPVEAPDPVPRPVEVPVRLNPGDIIDEVWKMRGQRTPLDLTPAIANPSVTDPEYLKNIEIYNKLLNLAQTYQQGDELYDFLKHLTSLKDIIQNQQDYKAMFSALYQDNSSAAIDWLRQVLFRSGFACHPYEQGFDVQDYVETTFNSIFPIFTQIEEVLNNFPERIIIKMADTISGAIPGVCLENTLRGFEEGASKYKRQASNFDPTGNKLGNIGEFANDFRSNLCLECLIEKDTDEERSLCLRTKLTQPVLKNYLEQKLRGKVARDGVIDDNDIQILIDSTFEFLFDCGNLFDYDE